MIGGEEPGTGTKQTAYAPGEGGAKGRKGDRESFLSGWLIWLRYCVILLGTDTVRRIGIHSVDWRFCIMKKDLLKHLLYAGAMGLLTILLCLVVADHIFGLNAQPAESQMGHPIFWISLIGLPVLFHKSTPWKYTLLNIPLYFLLFFPVWKMCGLQVAHHLLLQSGGFIEFPAFWNALLVTALFWGVQSLVYLVLYVVSFILRKRKSP